MESIRERQGYVLLDRNMCDWQWWNKHKTVIVFLWLLMNAQYHESFFGGQKIERGQVATTLENIERKNSMSRQEVRTAISNLKKTNAITIKRCSKFMVITIVNYAEYQNLTITPTVEQHSNNNHLTFKKPYTNTYNTDNTSKRRKKESLRSDFPERIEDINPEVDLAGFPSFDEMPCEADGTKRDIPPRVRQLFNGDYGAYWRYMEKCRTQ